MAKNGYYKTHGNVKSPIGYVPIIHATTAMMEKRGFVFRGNFESADLTPYRMFTDGQRNYAIKINNDVERRKIMRYGRPTGKRPHKYLQTAHTDSDYEIYIVKDNIRQLKNYYTRSLADYRAGINGVTPEMLDSCLAHIEREEKKYRNLMKNRK